jgi:hypothetical protein
MMAWLSHGREGICFFGFAELFALKQIGMRWLIHRAIERGRRHVSASPSFAIKLDPEASQSCALSLSVVY